jgi:hypothetical protein
MKKITLLLLIVSAALTLAGCDDTQSNPDPEGTIELRMRNSANGNTYLTIQEGEAYISLNIGSDNNFNVIDHSYYGDLGNNLLCGVGSVSGLGSVKSIPTAGWTNVAAVVPGNGYVIRFSSDRGTVYARLFVVDWTESASSGGIIGAQVKYQFPFNP